MCISRDDDLDACFPGEPGVNVAQVEPVRLRVDLEEGAGLEGLLDHPLDVDLHRPADVQLPAGQVADAVDIRVVERPEDALGRASVEARVDRRHHPVEPGQGLVVDVELAVHPDVHLDPFQDPERLESGVQPVQNRQPADSFI